MQGYLRTHRTEVRLPVKELPNGSRRECAATNSRGWRGESIVYTRTHIAEVHEAVRDSIGLATTTSDHIAT